MTWSMIKTGSTITNSLPTLQSIYTKISDTTLACSTWHGNWSLDVSSMLRWSVLTLTWHFYLQVYSSFIESIMLYMVLICWELMICAPVNLFLPMTTLFHMLFRVWGILVRYSLVANRWCRPNSFWVWFGIHIKQYTFSISCCHGI